MDKAFGPFTVAPGQVSSLGVRFTPFVNELLRVAASAAGLEAGQLTTTYRDNIGDMGVDAGLRRAISTKYIPAGDSAWQFKAGDLQPGKCRTELRGTQKTGEPASLAILRAGGSYRLVLGADLNNALVARRRAALEDQARTLGINIRPGMFEVLNASDLAAWATEHPSLAVSPLLEGIGLAVRPFASWSESSRPEARGSPLPLAPS